MRFSLSGWCEATFSHFQLAREYLKHRRSRTKRTSAAFRLRSFRPVLEELEDRLAPATYVWNNVNGGDWDTVSNWNVGGVAATKLPGSGDDVVINIALNAGASVTHSLNTTDSVSSITAADPIALSAGTLNVAGAFSDSSTATLAGGTLAGQTLELYDNWTLNGGTINGGTVASEVQTVTVGGSAGMFTLTFNGQTTSPLAYNAPATGTNSVQSALAALTNIGSGNVTVSQSGSVYTVTFQGSAAAAASLLTGAGSGGTTATVANVSQLQGWGTLSGVTLDGTLDANVNPGFSGNGPVTITNGLTLASGSIEINSAAELNFSGSQTLGGTGEVLFNAGNYTNQLNVLGSATLTIASGVTIDGIAASISADGSGAAIDNYGILSVGSSGGGTNGAQTPAFAGGQFIILGAWINEPGATMQAVNDGSLALIAAGGIYGGGGLVPNGVWMNDAGATMSVTGNSDGGGSLCLEGNGWSNAGTISMTNSSVFLGGSSSGPNGTFTLAALGTLGTNFERSGGTVYLAGTLNNTGTILALNNSTGSWQLDGGTINGGTVTTAGTAMLEGFGALSGVTLDGKFNANDGGTVTFTNGLTLGSGVVETTTLATLSFSGTQTLGGTGEVLFNGGDNPNNRLNVLAGTTLTINSGITIEGVSATISADASGSAVDNYGALTAGSFFEGGTFIIQGAWINEAGATMTAVNDSNLVLFAAGGNNSGNIVPYGVWMNDAGATMSVTGNSDGGGGLSLEGDGWSNNGTIAMTDSSVFLGGTFTLAALGNFSRSGGTVYLTGTLENTDTTLALNNTTGTWELDGGTINGGTITTSGSAELGTQVLVNGTTAALIGPLTLAGKFDDNAGTSDPVMVTNGLTLSSGLVQLDLGGVLNFSGTETLGGSGAILFTSTGGNTNSFLGVTGSGSVLTIGAGITVHGQSGTVTAGSGTIINQGQLSADASGGQLHLSGAWTNDGVIQATGGAITLLGSVSTNQSGALAGFPGASITAQGNLLGSTTNTQDYAPPAVTLAGSGTASSPQLLEAMSADLGNVAAGFQDNFADGSLALANNTYVELVDDFPNAPGTGPQAVYAGTLVVPAGTTLNMNGLNVYARADQVAGTIVNGSVSLLPTGGPIQFATPTPGDIATSTQVDTWTFFGDANQAVQVLVGTGSGSTFAPLSPGMNFAQVQLVGPTGTVLATASNSTSGKDATLVDITLPADGTYEILVTVAPGHASSTGHYLLSLWDATTQTAALNLNETTYGQLDSPYAVDQWTFAASANQQVQFDLMATAAPGFLFNLTGPSGYTAFTNATTSSSLINLPTAGTYTLTAHATQPTEGAFSFDMQETSVTPLSSGVPYDGLFAGSGQPQLFTITAPQDKQLLIALEDNNPGDVDELYASEGAPPTRADFQYESISQASGSQTVLVPSAVPGTWYILVYAANVAAPPAGYSLTATISPVALTAVLPTRFGTAEDAVLTLTGAGFDSTTTVSLVAAGGTVYQANETELDLPTQLTATFTAGSVPAGVYSVVVTRADGFSATLPSAYTMIQGGEDYSFHANLVTPSTLGYHIASTLYLDYSNTGDLPMPAPILEVTVSQTHADGTTDQEALLTLDQSIATQGLYTDSLPAGFSNSIQILAGGAVPGVLEPGESEQIPIYWAGWEQPWDLSHPNFDPEIAILDTSNTTPIPWSTLQTQFQPPSLTTAAWNAVFPAVETLVGSTWGDYVQTLDNAASYLGNLGEKVTDLNQLWSFVIQQAAGEFTPVHTLSSITDAEVTSPGPALSVDRVFANYIDARTQLGSFGYGWTLNDQWWQSLSVAADGSVTIVQDGMPELFEPDSRGGYFSMAGVNATLTAGSGGTFLLQDSDGAITAFNSNGQVAYIEDTNGNTVTAGYTSGSLTSLTASTGQGLTFTWDGAGRITSVTDSTGRTTTYAYDPTNQYLLSVTDFNGQTTSYTYDTSGAPATENALLSVQNPDGTIDEFAYDAEGRLASTYTASVTVPGQNTMQITYAYALGEVSATDADGGTTQYFFDARGLPVKTMDPLGNATYYVFDSNLNLTQVIDPAGQITSYVYDPNGNLIQSTNPDGDTVSYTYSGPFNHLTSYTDGNGNTTSYAYSSQSDLLSITYPNQTTQQFSYNPVGDLTDSINGNGQAINYTYNSMGLPTEETFADGTTATYTYDAHGNMLTATNSTGTTTFRYDPVNENLLEVSYPGGFTLTFQYDSAGRRTQSVDQDGFTVNYSYNSAGQLAALTDGNGNLIVSYDYDAAGKLILKEMGNGTYTTYQYDLAGNLLHLINYAPGGSINSRFDYTFNNLNLQTSMTTLDGVWTYQYDPAGQLTQALFASNNPSVVPDQSLQYMYDPAGNRTETIINGVTTTYVTNDMNQVTQAGSTTYSYDADGNLIAQTNTNGTTNYTYNELNQLTEVSSPTSVSTYQYDPLGQLASMTQNGQITQYIVDPTGLGNIVGEYNGSGGLIADYTYGLGLTSMVPVGGQAAYYDFDGLGSTVGITGAAGTYQNLYRYLPFGVSLTSSGTIANPFQFVGQYGVMTQANGLDFMRARFYSSSQGGFLGRDPLGLAGGQTNLYVYARQNPIYFIDPTGLTVPGFGEPGDFYFYYPPAPPTPGPPTPGPEGPHEQPWPQPWPKIPPPPPPPPVCTVINLPGGFQIALCAPPPPPPAPTPGPGGGALQCPVSNPGDETIPCGPGPGSKDPNAKTGPVGYGPQGFTNGNSEFAYLIDFENDPTATAPAQRVVITDPLNANIDWSTFEFTGVGFGDNMITVPAGSQHFQTSVTMTYNGLTFNVEIELDFDTSTGLVTVSFQSIDPATGLPPANVLTGFLPPEDGTGRGLGYVSYMALPVAGLPTGTQITNVAVVTFDNNQPLATDLINDDDPGLGVDPTKQDLNTIDAAIPISSVTPLPAFSPASFTVSWSGQDAPGSAGLADYNVYVSDDGGPYTLWQYTTTATSAVYTGVNGHTYSFYSICEANDGNLQPLPAGAQATTTVDTIPPSSSVSPLPATETSSSFTVNWTAQDNPGGSGVASVAIYVSEDSGPFALWQSFPASQTSATYTGQNGHTYGFYSIATDNVGNVQATPAAAQATTTVQNQASPTFTGLSAPTIVYGTASTTLSGHLQANAGSLLVPSGEAVDVTLDNTTQVAFLDGSDDFSTSFSTGALAVAGSPYTVGFSYAGDTDFAAASGSSTLTVNRDGTTGYLSSSVPSSQSGQSVTLTATFTADAPGSGTPTGIITFLDGTTNLGTASLSGGTAMFATSSLAPGIHSISASYAGDPNFLGNTSNTVAQTVNGTTTAVVSAANPSVYGQKLKLSATVTAIFASSRKPTGTVTFLDGQTVLGTATLNSQAKATFTTTAFALVTGTHSITAAYSGSSTFAPSTSTVLTQTVNQDASTTKATSSASTAVVGQKVRFTAAVTAEIPGRGIPTGTVSFYDGTTLLGTASLNGSGRATLITSSLGLGSHSITISYGGDTNYLPSASTVLTETINQAATRTTVASSHSTSVFGESVTLTATVAAQSPGSGVPTGTVTFMDGTTQLGTGALNATGHATFQTAGLAVGSHSITAIYGGDANYATSTSAVLSQTVNEAATTSQVMSSVNPAAPGQMVTFTALVLATVPGAGIPTGTATFYDGSTVLGTQTLNGTGQATLTMSWTTAGRHSIKVQYSGDTDFKSSTSPVLRQTVS